MFGKIISYVTFTLFLIFILLFRFNAPAYGDTYILYPSQEFYLPPGKKMKQPFIALQNGILEFSENKPDAVVIILEDIATNTQITLNPIIYIEGNPIEELRLNSGRYLLLFINSDYTHGMVVNPDIPTEWITP